MGRQPHDRETTDVGFGLFVKLLEDDWVGVRRGAIRRPDASAVQRLRNSVTDAEEGGAVGGVGQAEGRHVYLYGVPKRHQRAQPHTDTRSHLYVTVLTKQPNQRVRRSTANNGELCGCDFHHPSPDCLRPAHPFIRCEAWGRRPDGVPGRDSAWGEGICKATDVADSHAPWGVVGHAVPDGGEGDGVFCVQLRPLGAVPLVEHPLFRRPRVVRIDPLRHPGLRVVVLVGTAVDGRNLVGLLGQVPRPLLTAEPLGFARPLVVPEEVLPRLRVVVVLFVGT